MTNKGPLPRFIGRLPTTKSAKGWVLFGSITEMVVAAYLDWEPEVAAFEYEAHKKTFPEREGLPATTSFPDFSAVMITGEMRSVEAKYSMESLSTKERAKLARLKEHYAIEQEDFWLLTRKQVEAQGRFDHILFLRPYGQMEFADADLQDAERRLRRKSKLDLDGWQRRAKAQGVDLRVLYHLLYHGRLPLRLRPFIHPMLKPWVG